LNTEHPGQLEVPDRETQSCHAQRKQTAKLIPWTKQIEFAGKAYIPRWYRIYLTGVPQMSAAQLRRYMPFLLSHSSWASLHNK
jgi:hypothetical protein